MSASSQTNGFPARLISASLGSWKSLAILGFIGAAAGAVASLVMKPQFESSAAFQAEPSSSSSLSGSLASLASQFGNFNIGGTTNAQFFADILTDGAVLRRVAADTFSWKGHRATLAEIYGENDQPPAIRNDHVVEKLRRNIAVSSDNRTNTVRFVVTAPSPALARDVAEAVLRALNEVNIGLRQARASAEQAFTTERAETSRQELANAEQALTRFYERNRSISNSPALQTEESRLRRMVDMTQTIYTQLRLQQEQAAVQAVRNTPAISVIDPPVEPVRKSKPKRRVITMLGLLAGLALGGVRLALSSVSESDYEASRLATPARDISSGTAVRRASIP